MGKLPNTSQSKNDDADVCLSSGFAADPDGLSPFAA